MGFRSIEQIMEETPELGKSTEMYVIFVESEHNKEKVFAPGEDS